MLPGADYTLALAAALAREDSPCRWLQLLSAGSETLLQHGVPSRVDVTNAGSVWSPLVAEHTLGLMLAVARRLPKVLAAQAERRWQGWDGAIRRDMESLMERHLVIVGMGSIGSEVAARARAFGMRITGVSRSGRAHPHADAVLPVARLHEALADADYVVVAVPGSPQTQRLVGSRELAACPAHAVLLNVGRGSAVDTDALVQALTAGTIAAAALDVTDPEPLPESHPLWRAPNVILSPHLAGAAPERYNARLVRHVSANVRSRLAGLPLNDRVSLQAAA